MAFARGKFHLWNFKMWIRFTVSAASVPCVPCVPSYHGFMLDICQLHCAAYEALAPHKAPRHPDTGHGCTLGNTTPATLSLGAVQL